MFITVDSEKNNFEETELPLLFPDQYSLIFQQIEHF